VWVGACKLNSSGSRKGPGEGSYEHSNEPSGSIYDRGFGD